MQRILAIGSVGFVVVWSLQSDRASFGIQQDMSAGSKERPQMKSIANATFEIDSWDEAAFNEIVGAPKLTRAKVAKTYHGDIEGESTLEYLMMYRQDGTASFVGFERIVGSLKGRSGSFVLQHKGVFEDGKATTDWFIVPKSGTGDLKGLIGQGSFAVGHAKIHPMQIEYIFD